MSNQKQFQIEEFLPIYSQAKKDKDQGCYEDFLECLKLYDKNENGLMLGAELTHTLLALGEKLSDAEVDEVVKDCMDTEDDDGMIPYARNIPEEGDGVEDHNLVISLVVRSFPTENVRRMGCKERGGGGARGGLSPDVTS
ncbi:unnamed protein product [Diatraea saccharalis]|uniref:Myosin light chain alkali n=1 Tax=Diatraea saccharalis TaxID=40085 RepID=A0A9N9R132_9NEOP|nr:unnamed protein product [Diatraea saccharalis]